MMSAAKSRTEIKHVYFLLPLFIWLLVRRDGIAAVQCFVAKCLFLSHRTTVSSLYTFSQSTKSSSTISIPTDNTNESNEEGGTKLTSTKAPYIDPKDGVRIFGRLAEKYIALDSSGGKCCYSGCTNCEYRLPGGGYIMADQSSARPKWIPSYVTRTISSTQTHTTQWSTALFPSNTISSSSSPPSSSQLLDDTDSTTDDTNEKVEVLSSSSSSSSSSITKDEFILIIVSMDYTPPLGGPYVGSSDGNTFHDPDTSIGYLFDVLVNRSSVRTNNNSTNPTSTTASTDTTVTLSKIRMSTRLKQLAEGGEGLTWPLFSKALGIGQ